MIDIHRSKNKLAVDYINHCVRSTGQYNLWEQRDLKVTTLFRTTNCEGTYEIMFDKRKVNEIPFLCHS
jgi:hypothetical protein